MWRGLACALVIVASGLSPVAAAETETDSAATETYVVAVDSRDPNVVSSTIVTIGTAAEVLMALDGVVVVRATAVAASAFAGLDGVEGVRQTRMLDPVLAESVPLVGADVAQAGGTDGAGGVAVVIDAGVDPTQPALAGRLAGGACILTGFEPSDGVLDPCPNGGLVDLTPVPETATPCSLPTDLCAHGTHIAGVIVADGADITGVAPGATVLGIRSGATVPDGPDPGSDPDLRFPELAVVGALLHVGDLVEAGQRIDVVNLSLGVAVTTCEDALWEPAIERLDRLGVHVVAASGNDSAGELRLPACLPFVTSVGATDGEGAIAGFTNRNASLDLVAPGVDVESTAPLDNFPTGRLEVSGTSFAAPHVAGADLLVGQAHPGFEPERRRQILRATAEMVDDVERRYPEIRVDQAVAFEPFIDAVGRAEWVIASDWLKVNEISIGLETGEFAPALTLTRGQAVTLLWRFAGSPVAPPAGFVDVDSGAFYAEAVDWAAATGVTLGVTPTEFGPDLPMRRGQLATMLWRLAGGPPAPPGPSFVDVPPGAFYELAVAWMAAWGITVGTAPDMFSPELVVDRGQTALFLHRLAQLGEAWAATAAVPEGVLF